jgi:anaerobic selenocysteine-containing dehydrogenase
MSPNLVDWKEPSNCPKCGCGWGILIKPDDTKVIFCSNARCTFAWKSEKKTLLDAVILWNKICENHDDRDRPKTPLLVRIYDKIKNKDLTTIIK